VAADAMTLRYNDLPQEGRMLSILHEVLSAWGSDIDGAIKVCEDCPDEVVPGLLEMLRLVRQRKKSGQFLRRRKGPSP
jgi:hypothetical protein